MSTRCNIIIKDKDHEMWFYRHSDGYPTSVIPDLRKFMNWVRDGKIRDNVSQAAGWLVVMGHFDLCESMRDWNKRIARDAKKGASPFTPQSVSENGVPAKDEFNGWKVGHYEPTTGQHGDIEYLYTLDLTNSGQIVCDNLSGEVKTYGLSPSKLNDF